MSDAIEAVKRAAYKSKRQRDNWKARYVALEAALRDDALAEKVALESDKEMEFLVAGLAIDEYRARLLAKIDDKETP